MFFIAIKNIVKDKHKDNGIWRDLEWYTKLRDDLEDIVKRKMMLGGESINEKCKPIGRTLLVKIARHYLQLGTQEAMFRRSAILCSKVGLAKRLIYNCVTVNDKFRT